MYPVAADFHRLAIQDAPKTRVRIYFIGDAVDCTDDADVVANGTLLVGEQGDTDSNKRIAQNGVVFNELFNSDLNPQIGTTVSSQIELTFLNSDGMLDNFAFGRCKVYVDVYDADSYAWLACPMGVYNIDIPTRRKVQLISAFGYDQMQLFDEIADTWWNGLNWSKSGGLTVLEILQSMCATLGISLSANTSTQIVNGSLAFTENPSTAVEITYREILERLAETAGAIARFDRDGALDLRWFSQASMTVDADTLGNNCLEIEVAEYQVAAIDALQVKSSETDVGAVVGTGSNAYNIINNPLMGGADEATITNKATPIYNQISGLGAYSPISQRIITDWSVESGDIINVIYRGNTYQLPIFQQTITWRGAYVISEMLSSGDTELPLKSGPERREFRTQTQLHEFEVTLDNLRSLIQSVDGNYTLIEQTVNAIEQTVSAQGTTIQNILDPTGEIWTAITTNSTNLGAVENALNAEITERKSYIRFIPAEPAIVLGVDTGNEIKLKLANDKIWFFNGEDDSTDLSLAFAYFNSQEVYARRFVGGDSVQIGTNDDANHWIWKKLDNGDLVLDVV